MMEWIVRKEQGLVSRSEETGLARAGMKAPHKDAGPAPRQPGVGPPLAPHYTTCAQVPTHPQSCLRRPQTQWGRGALGALPLPRGEGAPLGLARLDPLARLARLDPLVHWR
jgi:hypothetical protein